MAKIQYIKYIIFYFTELQTDILINLKNIVFPTIYNHLDIIFNLIPKSKGDLEI